MLQALMLLWLYNISAQNCQLKFTFFAKFLYFIYNDVYIHAHLDHLIIYRPAYLSFGRNIFQN